MTVDPTVVGVVAAYMAILLGIGYAAARLTRSPEDFFLANRSLGAWVTAISSTASSESGWVVLGAVGMVYVHGVSALAFAPSCLAGYLVNLYWLAPRLRRASQRTGALTLPDLLVARIGDRLHLLRLSSVAIIALCLGAYVAAQMTATGKAMEAIVGLTYSQGILVGGAIIVIYTLMGGFRAVAWTDFVQGVIMAVALLTMPVLAVLAAGGYGTMLERLAATDPALVTVTGGRTGFALFGFVAGLLGIGIGYPGQPHVLTRYMAAADDETIRRSQVIAMIWGVVVFFGAGYLGLAGRLLMPELGQGGDPEQLFPLLARALLHPGIAGLMLAAVLSAIMSTVSSQLLVAASAVSRDLFEKVFGAVTGGRASVLAGRLSVLLLGIAAMVVAWKDVRVVFWFVLFAWSGMGAAFGPLLLLSLAGCRVSHAGAVTGVVTGFAVTVVWKLTGLSDRLIYELVPAFLLATLAVVAVSWAERRLTRPAPVGSVQRGC